MFHRFKPGSYYKHYRIITEPKQRIYSFLILRRRARKKCLLLATSGNGNREHKKILKI